MWSPLHGSGGFQDSDTLYGLARDLPQSSRRYSSIPFLFSLYISCLKSLELKYIDFHCRYTTENSVKFGAPRDTDHPELRQPLALEIWTSILKTLDPGSKITILTNGPLTSLAKIITETKTASLIQVLGFYLFLLFCYVKHLKGDNSKIGSQFVSNTKTESKVFQESTLMLIVKGGIDPYSLWNTFRILKKSFVLFTLQSY